MSETGLHVAFLGIHDFMAIEEAQLEPGKVALFEGKNRAGKTAFLKAVETLFRGAGADVIRVEADKAQILVRLNNGTKVSRTISRAKSQPPPRIETADGLRPGKPQAWLNQLFGPGAFNPIEFVTAKPRDRRNRLMAAFPVRIGRDEIKAATGYDPPGDDAFFDRHALDVMAELHDSAYSRRAEANAAVKDAQAHLETHLAARSDQPDGPDTSGQSSKLNGSVATLSHELAGMETALEYEATNEKRRANVKAKLENVRLEERKLKLPSEAEEAALARQIEDLKARLAEAEKRQAEIERVKTDHADLMIEAANLENELKEIPAPKVMAEDLDAKRGELERAQAAAEHATQWDVFNRAKAVVQDAESRLAAAKEKATQLDALVKVFRDDLPARIIAGAEIPIPGVRFSGDQITVDGKDFDQLSTSEQLLFALEVAKALAGDLKLICVDRAESLDGEAMASLVAEAQKDDFRYFITRVADEPAPGSFHVEKGLVRRVSA